MQLTNYVPLGLIYLSVFLSDVQRFICIVKHVILGYPLIK